MDEAGRGPIAGPVVAACVIINYHKIKFQISNPKNILKEVNDSKKLSAKKREKLFKILTKSPFIGWGIGIVSEKIIDKINILEATKLAMKHAVAKIKIKNLKLMADYLILDGNIKLDLPIPQKAIVKADQKVMSCAAASILAKVTRDRIMAKYDKKYPRYGFLKHKGYPTKKHIRMLKKYGPCPIHRKSFGPVKLYKH